jgi:hypothetical protein
MYNLKQKTKQNVTAVYLHGLDPQLVPCGCECVQLVLETPLETF